MKYRIKILNPTIGVPVSYLNVHNPEQFEIVGVSGKLAEPIRINGKTKKNPGRFYVFGRRFYERVVIRRRVDNEISNQNS